MLSQGDWVSAHALLHRTALLIPGAHASVYIHYAFYTQTFKINKMLCAKIHELIEPSYRQISPVPGPNNEPATTSPVAPPSLFKEVFYIYCCCFLFFFRYYH